MHLMCRVKEQVEQQREAGGAGRGGHPLRTRSELQHFLEKLQYQTGLASPSMEEDNPDDNEEENDELAFLRALERVNEACHLRQTENQTPSKQHRRKKRRR